MHPPTQTERQALDAAITRTTTTRRKPRKESTELPYPARLRDDASYAQYWLAAWFRYQREFEAFDRLVSKAWSRGDQPLHMALCSAGSFLRKEANDALGHCVSHGGLLFAWHGTTALDNLTVPR